MGRHGQDEQHRTEIDLVSIAARVLRENGFKVEFPPEVIAEIEHVADPAKPSSAVVDMRAMPWTSIDNRESKDLDQIEVSERVDGGGIRLSIAIADVDAWAPKGSLVDQRAFENTASIYTGVAVFPMIPDTLSEDRTSLNEGEDRLAVVTEMIVMADGTLTGERVYRALVKNHAKLAYPDVAPWLEGTGEIPGKLANAPLLAEQVKMQNEASERLQRRRQEKGALELETTEARPVAKDGHVVDLELQVKSRSKELVEDLMIAANGVTARYLEAKGFPSIRRIVKTPRRWERIVDLARGLGFELPAEPSSIALSKFLEERRRVDRVHFADLSLSVVKLLGPGEYLLSVPPLPGEPERDEGHFGLAVQDYTHSTAPNRRYPDLVTQRLLKAAAAGAPCPYVADELAVVATRCTQKENDARKVERTMRKVAAADLLSTRIGEEFEAIVTGVTPKGTFVRLLAPPAEGRVVSGEKGLDVGDTTRVRLVATEPSKGFIDFARAVPS
jgi:exoribonuclease-2